MILFFGYVRPYKGLEDLIAALPSVLKATPATLVVAGPFYQTADRFSRQARRLGIEDSIRLFPGYVPDDEVGALFSLADVIALPYRSASQSGILPLAARYEKSVVATAVGGIPEALNSNGILVPAKDPEALAGGLVRALREPPPPPSLAAQDWDAAADAILSQATPTAIPATARRNFGRVALRVAAWSLVGLFVGKVFVEGIRGLSASELDLSFWPLAAASLAILAARVTDVISWHLLLRGTGVEMPMRASARIFTSAELVRFLPGGMLHLAARYRLASSAGVSSEAIVTTTALDLGLRIIVALVVFILSVPAWPTVPRYALWLSLGTLPIFLFLFQPKVISWALTKARNIFGGRGIGVAIPRARILYSSGWVLGGWILRAVATFCVATSLKDLPVRDLIPLAGVTSISWVAGVLTLVAPGGLGVREAAGASLLRPLLGLPLGIATMLILRVLSIVVEVVTTWAAMAWDMTGTRRYEARPVPVQGDEGSPTSVGSSTK